MLERYWRSCLNRNFLDSRDFGDDNLQFSKNSNILANSNFEMLQLLTQCSFVPEEHLVGRKPMPFYFFVP
jgi:hypothetical protein